MNVVPGGGVARRLSLDRCTAASWSDHGPVAIGSLRMHIEF